MKVSEFEVAYGKKFCPRSFESELVSLTLKVAMEDGDDLNQKVHEAFSEAREKIDEQERLSRQQNSQRKA